ncbi:hypothetical protein LTR16_012780, partial [Cryomyces antarcticus]
RKPQHRRRHAQSQRPRAGHRRAGQDRVPHRAEGERRIRHEDSVQRHAPHAHGYRGERQRDILREARRPARCRRLHARRDALWRRQ